MIVHHTNHRNWTLLVAVIVGLSSGSLMLCAADSVTVQELEARRQRIGQMTSDERLRLESQGREFQSLKPEQQESLRQLQRAIDAEPGLKATLADYQNWLNTLTPLQRSELRKAPDSKARMALVNEFRRRTGPDLLNPPGELVLPSRTPDQSQVVMKVLGNLRLPPVPQPSSEEFAALIQVLESRLPPERREALQNMDSFTRQVHVVEDSVQRLRRASFDRRAQDTDENLAQQIVDVLEEGSPLNQFLMSQPELARRWMLFPILFRGLITELILAVDLYFPSDDEISRFEETLSPGERDFIAKQPEDEWLPAVRLKYLEARVPGIRDFRASSRTFEFLMNSEWRRRGGPNSDRGRSGPPNDGQRQPDRDRERPRFDDRRPD